MTTLQSKVTSKGQVTLPKHLRNLLSIRSGDRLEFSLENTNEITIRKKRAPGSSAGCGKKFINPGEKVPTIEEMDTGVREGVRKKYGHLRTRTP